MVEVRTVGPDDWRLWRELRRSALAEAPAAFGSTLQQWSGAGDTEDRWRRRLTDVPLNLVLLLDGEPAGMVSAVAGQAPDTVELISLWVAPRARGHGLGDTAVRAVLAWGRQRDGVTQVVLSVRASNQHAVALYQRHGFVAAGPSPDDADEVLMRRSLSRG